MAFEKIDVKSLALNPFVKIGHEWMLVTAGEGDAVNTMTASWGGMGVLWNEDVAFVFIRPQRYTREFVDAQERFTLSFFDGAHKEELRTLGTCSGRDGDKIKQVGFDVCELDGAPAFAQAKLVLVLKKLYRDTLRGECFLDARTDEKNYPQKDYHIVYVARIEAAYQRA